MIEQVAISQFQHLARTAGIKRKDVESLREWTNAICPESTSFLTGKALGGALSGGGGNTTYAELGNLAVEYSRAEANDDVLVAFLKDRNAYLTKSKEVRALAEKIADEDRRKELLDLLD